MKFFFLTFTFLFFISCSLDKNSSYWNEDLKKRSIKKNKLSKIIKKTNDFNMMTFEEFDLFLEDYASKNNYPNIEN